MYTCALACCTHPEGIPTVPPLTDTGTSTRESQTLRCTQAQQGVLYVERAPNPWTHKGGSCRQQMAAGLMADTQTTICCMHMARLLAALGRQPQTMLAVHDGQSSTVSQRCSKQQQLCMPHHRLRPTTALYSRDVRGRACMACLTALEWITMQHGPRRGDNGQGPRGGPAALRTRSHDSTTCTHMLSDGHQHTCSRFLTSYQCTQGALQQHLPVADSLGGGRAGGSHRRR
jgi:hypothetical protein